MIFEARDKNKRGCANDPSLDIINKFTTGERFNGGRYRKKRRLKRDVREVTKYIETALVLDKAMVSMIVNCRKEIYCRRYNTGTKNPNEGTPPTKMSAAAGIKNRWSNDTSMYFFVLTIHLFYTRLTVGFTRQKGPTVNYNMKTERGKKKKRNL